MASHANVDQDQAETPFKITIYHADVVLILTVVLGRQSKSIVRILRLAASGIQCEIDNFVGDVLFSGKLDRMRTHQKDVLVRNHCGQF